MKFKKVLKNNFFKILQVIEDNKVIMEFDIYDIQNLLMEWNKDV